MQGAFVQNKGSKLPILSSLALALHLLNHANGIFQLAYKSFICHVFVRNCPINNTWGPFMATISASLLGQMKHETVKTASAKFTN